MKRFALLSTVSGCMFVVLLSSERAYCGKPEWVEKRPIIPGVYVGIGMTGTNRPASEYTETAKNIALNDIASQITVSISSDVLRKVFETQEKLGEEFQSQIRATARAELEGVQLVDTYEGDDEYWVYLRLSKAEYEARRAGKMSNAVAVAMDLYSSGRKNEQQGNIARALELYTQALGPIEKYIAEPLEVSYEGQRKLLVNEILSSLQTLLNRITIGTTEAKRNAKVGRPLKPDLHILATLDGTKNIPVALLPISLKFTRGSGDLVNQVQTDQNGAAHGEVHKITSSERIQMVEARLSLHDLTNRDSVSSVIQTIMNSFSVPSLRFVLSVSGVDVLVEADESMFGRKLQQNRIEPILKTRLGEKGFAFIKDASKASLLITIKADARKGAETHGLAFAYVSATVSVSDLETGQEVFKSSLSDVKEGSDTFEKAAYKAFDTAATRIADELLPGLVERVQK